MNKAMEQMLQMSPEQLQEQMQKAMEMLTEEDVVDKVIGQREQILKQLELSGAVPPDELAKFRADPEYFEQKMRESFDQMGDLFKEGFNDPKIMGAMQQMIQGMKDMMSLGADGGAGAGALGSLLQSDEDIEEARLELLSGKNPHLSALFDSEELQDLLKDPKKFRETVKQGRDKILPRDEL
jgi:hypothetical protein